MSVSMLGRKPVGTGFGSLTYREVLILVVAHGLCSTAASVSPSVGCVTKRIVDEILSREEERDTL